MAQLLWDQIGDRVYETGLDRGVLYLPNGSAVPWNGLTEIIEKFNKELSPVYYDGMKINELVVLGDFSASMRAITYPDEFLELEGFGTLRENIFLGDQSPKTFGLCYRSQISTDLDASGYKIHLIYNVMAIPQDKSYATISDSPNLMEFEWNIVAIPSEIPGFRPTAHLIIDSRNLDPWLLEDIEEKLYGSNNAIAALIPMVDLVKFISDWVRIKITNFGDGTWSAKSERPELITVYGGQSFIDPIEVVYTSPTVVTLSSPEPSEIVLISPDSVQISDTNVFVNGNTVSVLGNVNSYFQIIQANVVYFNSGTYLISDTRDLNDIPRIKFIDNGNGTWTVVTEESALITVDSDGKFTIFDTNAVLVGTTGYRVSDTR